MDFFDSARRSLPARLVSTWGNGIEQLEPRVLLSDTPLPSLADMEDKNNTLIRIETNMGTIDMELYDIAGPDGASAAPNTVANFLAHLYKGDFDLSFFHRYAKTQHATKPLPFVLQGGGFKWTAEDGLSEIDPGESIDNEFKSDRSNLERTVSMARLGGDVNSATTQWFINLKDHDETKGNNPNFINLDDDFSHEGGNDGYCVFARILDDRSWDVVTDITALSTEDGTDYADPITGALNELPTFQNVEPDPDPDGADNIPNTEDDKPLVITEGMLISISNMEVIKTANTQTFFRPRAAYPEGYRGPGTIESVELVNPDPDHEVLYQIIVRYEKGVGRDQVIKTGTLGPSLHLHVPVSDFNDPTLDLVRAGAPFAYEVQATGLIAAALNHYDFGALTSESFINLDTTPTDQLLNWGFGGTGTTGDAPMDGQIVRRPFLVWDNLSTEPAHITIWFTLQQGGRVKWTRTTDPMRRDGLEVFNLKNVSRDVAGIRIISDQKIVAAFTVYDTIVDPAAVIPPLSANNAFTALGSVGGGLTDGVIAGVRIGDLGTSYVSFVNHTNDGAAVTISFVRSNGGATTDPVLLAVPGRGRKFLNLRTLGIPNGEYFTIVYHSPLVAVAGEYISTLNGDSVSTPFSTSGASQLIFAGGRLDPTDPDEREVLSLYNPYSHKKVHVSITFNFADDKIQGLPELQFDMDPLRRKDIGVRTLAAIVEKIKSGAEFSNYAIIVNVSVEDDGTGGGSLGAAGLIGELTRYDLHGAITASPSLFQFTLPLNSGTYDSKVT